MNATTEEAFETLIVEHLLANGYAKENREEYDMELGLIPADVIGYAELAQPKVWAKLQTILGDSLDQKVIAELVKFAKKEEGILKILRHGLPFYGQTLRLATFQPAHGLNPEVAELYAANRVLIGRQVRYDPKASGRELDLVIFLNGVPIVTAELKNALTNQNAQDAVEQYRLDRDPDAPIFRFKERALVHFAVGSDEVYMTTRLAGKDTFFFPFNRGHGTGAGNPSVDGKHRTSYLWEEIWERDSLLDIVARFIHREVVDAVSATGEVTKKEAMIFPRFHQLEAVRKLVAATRVKGSGTNYLVQHSTGSGKSNTIAWLAHQLASLHDADDKKVYDSVVVITDRVVLDAQLQDTIYQIDHKNGVVQPIDEDSGQLASALKAGVLIVISTIHKFGFIADRVQELPDRRYAVIVDEAHSSQSGDMAANMKEILGKASIAAKFKEEVDDVAVPDQAALRAAIARGPQPNLSYFAFTATPKAKTLELFNHKVKGKPAPFHLYSMRQAIEEKFILDVLRGYTTYKRYFELVKAVKNDPELDKKKAAQALARFVTLHATNVAQKTEVIIEHFRATVLPKLGGRAKAMVVTDSRLMAVRYKKAFDKYIAEKNYAELRTLVAFSGEVRDPDDPTSTEKPYTEPEMNQDPVTKRPLPETELRKVFAGDKYNILIVANKYQTGFDQPLLCAMYVDKRLSGIQAVQTLSRLNRSYRGKDETFVLDFVNEREEILASFQDYFEGTTVEEESDPQRLHELEGELNDAQVFHQSEVDAFSEAFFKRVQNAADNAKMNSALDPGVDRFKALPEEAAEHFRAKLQAYCNLYGFLAQLVPFSSPNLEKLYVFAKSLLRKLPGKGLSTPPVDLGDDVALQYYRLEKLVQGTMSLAAEGTQAIYGASATGTRKLKPPPKERLSTLVQTINTRFATEFDAQDLVDAVAKQLLDDEKIQQAAAVNDKENFGHFLRKPLEDALIEKHGKNAEFIDGVFGNGDILGALHAEMLEAIYRKLKGDTRWSSIAKLLVGKGFVHSRLRDRKDLVPWQPAVKDAKYVMGLLSLGVQLAESEMPASFVGTKYAPSDLAGLATHMLEVLDMTERAESKGLNKTERNALAKSAAQLLEPFWARLLGELEPKALAERMTSFVEQKKSAHIGIGMLYQLLRERKRAPLDEAIFKLSPETTDGWEQLDSLSNAIRDLVAIRVKSSHGSPEFPPDQAVEAAWCAIVAVLSVVEHNQQGLRASPRSSE